MEDGVEVGLNVEAEVEWDCVVESMGEERVRSFGECW